MLFLDETIVNVALPSIKETSASPRQGLHGSSTPTSSSSAASCYSAARCDIFGRRRMFLVGTAVFGLACSSPARAVAAAVHRCAGAEGIGAALATPAALALVRTLFTEEKERAKALGVWGGLAGLGFASGVLLGG